MLNVRVSYGLEGNEQGELWFKARRIVVFHEKGNHVHVIFYTDEVTGNVF
jgi:hypothetical protein